jgi:hypothetical protein
VGTRLEWADISPYRAVLYQIDDESPINKKVASVEYDRQDNKFIAVVNHLRSSDVADAAYDIDTKVEAMETALAMLVAMRFDQANKT